MIASKPVQDIAVGILQDGSGRYLLAKRRPKTYGEGLWEFPGGKQEKNEAPYQTLVRELDEELGVQPTQTQFLIRFCHSPTGRMLRIHIWMVYEWKGKAYGKEGQKISWIEDEDLETFPLLPGNRVILNALRLPRSYAITPDPEDQPRDEWLADLATTYKNWAMVRLRAPSLSDDEYEALAKQAIALAENTDTNIILDRDAAMVERLGAQGLHWSEAKAQSIQQRPIGDAYYFGISAHSQDTLAKAVELDASFAVLSPVHATQSHPEHAPLGWEAWSKLRDEFNVPVYALGGLTPSEAFVARDFNAQGVAGIRAFWPSI